MQRSLFLVPLNRQHQVQPIACKENATVKVGRSKSNGLPASVSREAVEVTAKVASGALHLHVLVKSTAHVRRAAQSQTVAHKPGDELQVRQQLLRHAVHLPVRLVRQGTHSHLSWVQVAVGDQLFLGKAEQANGFSIQARLDTDHACVHHICACLAVPHDRSAPAGEQAVQ
jgi:FHA domain